MSFVVDASVAVKWFVREPLRSEARRLLQGDATVYAPDLVLAEVANIGWKLVRRGELRRNQALAMLVSLPNAFSALLPLPLLHERGLEIALTVDHPVYDCLYLACAEFTEAVLVTADARFCAALRDGPYGQLVRHLSDIPP